jgi:hypothetical protein
MEEDQGSNAELEEEKDEALISDEDAQRDINANMDASNDGMRDMEDGDV